MKTLPEQHATFKSNLLINSHGGELSSDGGLILAKEMMTKLHFSQLLRTYGDFNDHRKFCRYSNDRLIEQLVLQMIAGYDADSAAHSLQRDPVFSLLLDQPTLASQPTLSRFLGRCSPKTIAALQHVNQALIDQVRLGTNQTTLIIDVDSTHSDTYGHQEATAFNAHYGTTGYHPIVAFDGQTGACLKAELRPGNVYTSRDIDAFITPLLTHYQQGLPCTDILVRGDSGFATPELYETCEAHQTQYLIRLKANRRLYREAEQFISIGDDYDWGHSETHYHTLMYQADSWNKPRRIHIKSTRQADECLLRHEYLVTNNTAFTAEAAFKAYHQRGQMENYIKETKLGFHFDKTDSSSFDANHTRMMLSVLAYNLVNFIKQLLPQSQRQLNVATMRLWLFKIAGKVVRTGRRTYLKLSSYHVHQALFYQLLSRIQAIKW